VPAQDFLERNLTHAGTWDVLGRPCDAFSGRKTAQAGTWYWFDSKSANLARIMNVDPRNDFQVAVLGAYYFVDVPSLRTLASSTVSDAYKVCLRATKVPRPASPMVTLTDILDAMAAPPSGGQVPCTSNQIGALIPGISHPTRTIPPPSWTNRV